VNLQKGLHNYGVPLVITLPNAANSASGTQAATRGGATWRALNYAMTKCLP
jgi:hypothetical protein